MLPQVAYNLCIGYTVGQKEYYQGKEHSPDRESSKGAVAYSVRSLSLFIKMTLCQSDNNGIIQENED